MQDDTFQQDNQPNEPVQQSDEAQSQGRDVLDTERQGVTQGVDVTETSAGDEIETIGRTVVDHSHEAEQLGVDVLDRGPVSDTPDDGADY